MRRKCDYSFFSQPWKETEELMHLGRSTVKGKGGSGGQRGEWIVLLTVHYLLQGMVVVGFEEQVEARKEWDLQICL